MSDKPADIPQDVWDQAREAYAGYGLAGEYATHTVPVYERIARAIMAATEREREACALSLEGLRADQIRLHMGEVSAQGMRDITAFANWRATAIRQGSQPSNAIPIIGTIGK